MKRTLVKSAPELWELADDLARMEAWMAGLVGAARPVSVEVTDREPERMLAWRTSGGEAAARPDRARAGREGLRHHRSRSSPSTRGPTPAASTRVLEQLLDELGSPERRPFTRG